MSQPPSVPSADPPAPPPAPRPAPPPAPPPVLVDLGWDADVADRFAATAPAGTIPGRVTRADRGLVTVETAAGTRRATSGPGTTGVGDWVALSAEGDPPAVAAVLPRRSSLVRQAAGRETAEQVLAANLDTVFVLVPLDGTPSLRRLERALVVAWSSGATPVVVLTKVDRCIDPELPLHDVRTVAVGVDVAVTSSVTGEGLSALRRWTGRRADGTAPTVVLLGASGAGKSTLVNALYGAERMATSHVRAGDGRGRHTTTHRELVVLPDGGLLLDTPGLRELQLWDAGGDGLDAAFADIDGLAPGCRFRDCRHEREPGCAVTAAIDAGALAAERLASWRKLQRELAHQRARQDKRLAAEERRRWMPVAKANRRLTRERGDRW